MADANVLSVTDATGAMLWHPRGLADFDALPDRTFTLWRDMRDGMAARGEPWQWWRIKGIPTSHVYEATALGVPGVARCGYDPYATGLVAEWIRATEPPRCGACLSLHEQTLRPPQAWGQVGDPA